MLIDLRCSRETLHADLARVKATSSLFDATIERRTREIINAVRKREDHALLDLTERFDGVRLESAQLAVTEAEFITASILADERTRQAVRTAKANIQAFNRRSKRRNWTAKNLQGGRYGEKFDPLQRVGIYVPGGTAPLLSTALMTVTLAAVAGCPEIAVCTPCDRHGRVHQGLLYAARAAGATEVYRIGGAQAIAAMALGTPTIQRVQKIFGPGNAYVVAAKRLLFGHVAVDLLPGPSEVMVIADDTAEPRFAAADLLAQAEHGSGHERVWLVSPSRRFILQTKIEMRRQIQQLKRRGLIEKALENNGWAIEVPDLPTAAEVANALAPEHCEILTTDPESIAAGIRTAGAIFLGGYSPTVLGDYVAGPSHELPTGGAGASFPGLTVDQFQRRTSVVAYDRSALNKSLKTIETFAALEGLDAHGCSAAIRFKARDKRRRNA